MTSFTSHDSAKTEAKVQVYLEKQQPSASSEALATD